MSEVVPIDPADESRPLAVPPRPPPAHLGLRRMLHSGMTVPRYFSMHLLGALFPLTAGVLLYGWRAALTMAFVLAAAAASAAVWRQIGSRGRDLEMPHALWLAVLLGLMLPAHLASGGAGGGEALWPLPLAAGCLLVILLWLLGGLGAGRVHPVVVTYLTLAVLFPQQLVPHWVLQRNHLAAGDVLRGPAGDSGAAADAGEAGTAGSQPWVQEPPVPGHDALYAEPAARALTDYTTGRLASALTSARGQMPLHELLRDRMPPLEDLILAGQPAPIGQGSAVALIIGGLFLLYRGLIDFRVPLLVTLMAFAAMLVLPVPTVLTAQGAHRSWLAMRGADVRWETAVTFANYELTASPALFVAFFLATAGPLRPMGRRARVVYSVVLGMACAAAQLYLSVSLGPYVALLAVSLASPVFDRWFKPRALV